MKGRWIIVLAVWAAMLGSGCTLSETADTAGVYQSWVAEQSEQQLRHRENLALWYNHALAQGEDLTGISGGDLIGYGEVIALVELPQREEQIPVYAAPEDAGFVLAEGSALPVGGQKLPATLEYTRQWEGPIPAEGECFRVYVLDRVLCYRVTNGSAARAATDVCRLLLRIDGKQVAVVGVRVYPQTDFDGII